MAGGIGGSGLACLNSFLHKLIKGRIIGALFEKLFDNRTILVDILITIDSLN